MTEKINKIIAMCAKFIVANANKKPETSTPLEILADNKFQNQVLKQVKTSP